MEVRSKAEKKLNEMEQLEDKVRLLKLQEEKAGLMRKDVIIEERLCDVKVSCNPSSVHDFKIISQFRTNWTHWEGKSRRLTRQMRGWT